MSTVASKNLFALLGNDVEGDEVPSGPVKTVDKTTMRSTKRNAEPQGPAAKPATNTGARRAGPGGNEGAYRDRNAGAANNYRKSTDEAPRGGSRGGRDARVRGGRGGRFPRDRDDRHTKGAATGSDKQAAQSWGATEGNAEQKDEQAGEEIAQSELKESTAEDAQEAPATPAEPEDKHVSYADYLAQQAEKKLALGESLEIRKPNEGSKADKKWANAKALTKEEDDDFISGTAGKVKRERERKAKQLVEIDQRYVEPERTRGGRGGRGGTRGGAPRGEGRGRGGRGRGESRGDFRGGRGGGRENNSSFALSSDAFPSLGA
ncbi:uncharacterized protein GGS22DRAFT_156763 [Annulohypoxylon maeteangense]|uniref:uncharacterized protein n=1 Tax=Annulohypoxylon maeteangense TaxID=1927788 RepID=UPI002007E77A|nr:uncharacterized protein GGS22DRAFT_156763 [Annulohypoxylon maeteangense]KAI0887323.1 hypothetical protein GGS22DRAFT_156763 [Annulohypoxylon maeteangense]